MSLKINANYRSPFEYLAEQGPSHLMGFIPVKPVFAKLDERFYSAEIQILSGVRLPRRVAEDGAWSGPVTGGFQPLLDVLKEVTDAVAPYKSTAHVGRDLFSPVRGVGNIIAGVSIPPFAAVRFLYASLSVARFFITTVFKSPKRAFVSTYKAEAVYAKQSIGWTIEGVNRIILGVVQIPMCLKILPRGMRMLVSSKPTFEEDAGVQRVIKALRNDLNTQNNQITIRLLQQLGKKVDRAKRQGRKFESSRSEFTKDGRFLKSLLGNQNAFTSYGEYHGQLANCMFNKKALGKISEFTNSVCLPSDKKTGCR